MIASKKNIVSLVAVATLGMVLQSCGRTGESNKVEIKKGSGDATAGKPCTADSCPKVKFDIQGQGADATTFVGYMGQPVSWSVGAFAADGTQRDIGVFLSSLPSGAATASKGFDTVAVVNWTPNNKGQSTKAIKALVRDLSRCKVLGKSESKCSDPNASLADFDQEMEFSWRIESAPSGVAGSDNGAQVVAVSDLTCGGLQTTTNGQVMGGVIQTALPVFTGILSGDMSGIVGMLPNIIGTVSGGDEQKTPTQC